MKKIALVFCCILLLFGILLISQTSFAYQEQEINKEVLLVGMKSFDRASEIFDDFGISQDQIRPINDLNVYRISNPNLSQRNKLYVKKTFSSEIEFIDYPKKYYTFLTPNDYNASTQWGLAKIQAPSAWDATTGLTTNIIAILDTGINGTHEDLTGKVIAGKAFLNNGSLEYVIDANTDSDDEGHGTAVAGVASAITNNNKGIAGLDWNARLMPVKILDSGGSGWDDDIADGIIYAAQNGAKVINMSFGGPSNSSVLETAINQAHNTYGVLLVGASGNDNISQVSYPARSANVVAVGATNSSDVRCKPSDWGSGKGSNYGSDLSVVAPGNSIRTTRDTVAGNEYISTSGTSIASPFVAGLATLVWSRYTSFTNNQVKYYIESQADKVSGMGGSDFHNEYGYGRINAYYSLNPKSSTDPSDYNYEYVSQNGYPTLSQGQSYRFELRIRNTGDSFWSRSNVRLATDKGQDRIPSFLREGDGPSGWLTGNRIQMVENTVAPGDIGTFRFWMKVPSNMNPGTYREHFRLVADGITWMQDWGLYWDVVVN
jgi:thermitase